MSDILLYVSIIMTTQSRTGQYAGVFLIGAMVGVGATYGIMKYMEESDSPACPVCPICETCEVCKNDFVKVPENAGDTERLILTSGNAVMGTLGDKMGTIITRKLSETGIKDVKLQKTIEAASSVAQCAARSFIPERPYTTADPSVCMMDAIPDADKYEEIKGELVEACNSGSLDGSIFPCNEINWEMATYDEFKKQSTAL